MDPVSLTIGVIPLAFQFFQLGKDSLEFLAAIKDAPKDSKFVQTLLGVERLR